MVAAGWLVQHPADPPAVCSWCGSNWEAVAGPALWCPACDTPAKPGELRVVDEKEWNVDE